MIGTRFARSCFCASRQAQGGAPLGRSYVQRRLQWQTSEVEAEVRRSSVRSILTAKEKAMKRVFAMVMLAALFSSGTAGAVPFVLMFERDDDAGANQELVFRTYDSSADMTGNVSPSDTFSPIDIAGNFSTTGLTFDGLRYIVMFERDDDAGANQELVFRTYDSFADMIGNVSPSDTFSPIDIAGNFSTTGLTFDGLRYIVMFERDDDAGANQELVFRTYETFADMIGNVSPSDTFSPIDIAGNFSTTGMMALVDFDGGNPPNPIPLPSTLMLMMAALLAGAGRFALTGMARPRRA